MAARDPHSPRGVWFLMSEVQGCLELKVTYFGDSQCADVKYLTSASAHPVCDLVLCDLVLETALYTLYRDTSFIVPLGPYMYRRPMPRAVWWSWGGPLFYERGTLVAGASCFMLGISISVSHSTHLSRCLSSRHEPQVDLLGIRLYLHGNSHLKGPTFGI